MNQKNLLFVAGMAVPIIIMLLVLMILEPKQSDGPKKKEKTKLLMEMEPYRNLKIEEVNKISKRRYTVAGMDEKIIEDKDEISNVMYYLLNLKLGKETDQACEDNTTVYILNTKDNNEIKVEIECDWVIIDKNRYLIVK